MAPCQLSKGLETLKTARASYWLELASIWDRRHVRFRLRAARLASSLRRSPYRANVLQESTCPLLSPVVSHCWRIADEPWVKLSGTE